MARPTPWMRVLALTALLAVASRSTWAEALPVGVAAQAGYRSTHGLRVIGEAQWALTEVVALRMRGGADFFSGPVSGTIVAGPVASLDALNWVPGIYLLAGVTARPARPVVQLGAELKRYVSLHTAVVGNVGAEWSGERQFAALITGGVSYQF